MDFFFKLLWHLMTGNRRQLRRRQRRLLAEQVPRRVLEIGSGQRRGSRYFQSAVDLAPPTSSFTMTDLNPRLGHPVLDITTLEEFSEQFDLVLCCNVLEHISDIPAAVRGLAQVCDDAGWVFVSTPFVYPYHDEPNDFWRPTSHGLDALFRSCFDEVKLDHSGLRRFPFQVFLLASRPVR